MKEFSKISLDRQKYYPWILVGLLWLVSFLNSADRSILVAVMPQLKQQFHLNQTNLALINSLFFWVYAFMAFFSGLIGDNIRRSRLIILGLIFWSMATGMVSLASSFMMLLALRAMVAIGESTYYPSATALISDWHKTEYRSRALSIHQTAIFAGSGIGAIFAGFLADKFSWHVPFIIFAGIGIFYSLVLFGFLKDKIQTRISESRKFDFSTIKQVVSNPSAVIICFVFLLGNAASTALNVWAPTFVHEALGLNLTGSAIYGAASINIACFISVPIGGLLGDLVTGKFSIGRFLVMAAGLSLAGILLIPLLIAKTAFVVGAVLLASSIGKGLFDGCIYAAMHDVVPNNYRGTAVGLMTMLGFIGAGISPLMVAKIADNSNMALGLTSLAGLYFLAFILLILSLPTFRKSVLSLKFVSVKV